MRYFSLLLLSTLLLACGEDGGDTPPDPTTNTAAPPAVLRDAPATVKEYPTQTVAIEDVTQAIRLTGRVVPLQEATVSSQVAGQVLPTDKLLQEGKYYQTGEVMVRLDKEPLEYRLAAERSRLHGSLVGLLSDLSLDYPEAHPRWKAFTDDIQAREALPELPEIQDEQLRYFLSTRGISAQYYAIRAQEATLDDYTIKAPFSGRLTVANVDPGSVIQPGQPIATISRTDVYEVKMALPAGAVAQLAPGKRVDLRARSLAKQYQGTVNRFGPTIDPTTQSVTAFVRVSGPDLRTGLYLEGELPGERLESVAILPSEALNRDGSVLVITNGIVDRKEVDVALIEGDRVYLRGLATGDRVITSGEPTTIVGTQAR